MTLREKYNLILVRMHLRELLPKSILNNTPVQECGEEMVPLQSPLILQHETATLIGRKRVVDKLLAVAEELEKQHLRLYLWELYRSPEKQQKRRLEHLAEITQSDPSISQEQMLAMLNKRIAGVGGGHQSGGAVDLTLCDADGNLLDMGGHYMEHNAHTKTNSAGLTPQQRKNRETLKLAMLRQGFVNYPAEWWHYSYGDRMWAAYSHKKQALYGEINLKETTNTDRQ